MRRVIGVLLVATALAVGLAASAAGAPQGAVPDGTQANARAIDEAPARQFASDPPVPPVSDAGLDRRRPSTRATGNSVNVSLTDALNGLDRTPGARQASAPVGSRVPPLVEYLHAEVCGVTASRASGVWPCSPSTVLDHTDVCGTAPVVLPLWKRTRVSAGDPWTSWVLVADVTCLGTPDPTGEQILAAFRRLPIAPSTLHVQPDRGWVLVNMDTIAYADPNPQILSTTVLGVQVTFTVTTASFTWDYGEHRFTTTSSGHPYPHQDVAYRYEHLGTGRVDLVTTWQATYTTSLDPAPRPVPGTATTTTTGPSFEVVEARSRLTRGDCLQYPDDPGC